MNGDQHRRCACVAATLEQAHAELVALPGEQQTQGRRRRLAGTERRPENEQQGATVFGGQLQAAQDRAPGIRQPGDDGANALGDQRALASPGRVVAGRASHQQAGEIDAARRPRWRMQRIRRRDTDQPGQFVVRHTRQRRQKQTQFADAITERQQLDQPPTRPAATRQFAVEFRETRRHTGQRRTGQGIAAPDIRPFQDLSQRRRRKHAGGRGHATAPHRGSARPPALRWSAPACGHRRRWARNPGSRRAVRRHRPADGNA